MINNLDELKGKISLLDLVNENVITRREGKNHKGLCPFHQENTASFLIDTEQNVFYCFGCREGGDAIAYYQKLNNLEFREAITQLAEKYGVTLEQNQTEKQKQIASKQDKAYKLIGDVNKQFQSQLNQDCLDYLSQRKLTLETIKKFSLGYGGMITVKDKEIAKELGLLKNGELTYKNRLIIPIKDKRGLAIAFNARTLTNQEPKYIHSPNTYLWKKKDTLFGLDLAIPLIKAQDKVYVVEGCFDVMTAWQNNIPAVACLGTAISKKQLTELLKLTNNIIFCLDGDKTGQKAIYRTIESIELEIFSGVVSPKILRLPIKDISAYFEENEVTDFLNLTPIDWVEWLFRYYQQTEEKPILSVIKLITKFTSLAEKQKYIDLASQVLEGNTDFLRKELYRIIHKPLTEKIAMKTENKILSISEMQQNYMVRKQRRESYAIR